MSNEPPTENSIGMRGFNRTGREETTKEVLRPQSSPALVRRNMALIAVTVVAIFIVGFLAFQRSGLSFSDIFKTDDHGSFGTGAAQQKRDFDDQDTGK
jgi:hypothetical protein